MLKTSITDLLDSLNGKSEEVPKIIQQLCGKTLIFRFVLKEQNLTEGKEYYLVKKTFEPDEKLELQYSKNQDEEVRPISIIQHYYIIHFIILYKAHYRFKILCREKKSKIQNAEGYLI